MFSNRNDIRQEEKQVLINYCSVFHHRGLFSSFYRSPLVNLHAESRRDVAGSAGLELVCSRAVLGVRWRGGG